MVLNRDHYMQIRKVCIRSTFMDSIQTDFFNNPNIKYLLRIMKTMNRQHLHQDFTQNGKMDDALDLKTFHLIFNLIYE